MENYSFQDLYFDTPQNISPGTYFITGSNGIALFKKKIVVK